MLESPHEIVTSETVRFTFRNSSKDCIFGALPGTGNPALWSLIKYFCTRLQTCLVVRFPIRIMC